ncbi:MAG TPA: Xaa-Pro peptidase family protein [Gemmatimonadaceae bacterium]|nr:Xaa-Pro peptidase family protein [Gemmatimonadaceae bacterium]
MLSPESLADVQRALAAAGVDGWLLYDFRGLNPIASGLMRLDGMTTRRVFAWVPTRGKPVAITHAIEQTQWKHWPTDWTREIYASWKSLESLLAKHIKGKRVAMEYSAGDAVPYLDRVPAGVIEMVREAGATVVSSGELVSRFYATWNAENIASHLRSAEIIASVAKDAMELAGERARGKEPLAEHELMGWILDNFKKHGLTTDHGPNVSVGANAANPHYEPSADAPKVIKPGEILLIDLWAREADGGVWADQTWMASLGKPSADALEIWNAVKDARDAAIALVLQKAKAGVAIKGADVDDAARQVIDSRGFGENFTHRTGHSIDSRELHGSGPHLDNLETREERLLVPGVAFSIEPGIYIPGKIGMRTEVNVYITPGEAVVTPREYQKELMIV